MRLLAVHAERPQAGTNTPPLPTDIALNDQLDSIQLLSFTVALEDHFKICFDPEQDQQMQTPDHVVDVIKTKLRVATDPRAPTSVTLISRLVRNAAAPTAHSVTLIDRFENEQVFTWAALLERAKRTGAALREAGVNQGDHVALILSTRVEFFDVFFGASLIGAVPMPLSPPPRIGQNDEYLARTAAMLAAANAAVVVTQSESRRALEPLLTTCQLPLGLIEVQALQRADLAEPAEPAEADPDDLCLIQFSSGTTVAPKPVGLTHRQVASNISQVLEILPPREQQVWVGWLPLFHDMGLIGLVFSALFHNHDLVLMPPEAFLGRPAVWLRAISRHRGTFSPAPNFAWALCVSRISDEELEGCDLSSLAMAFNGAEPISMNTVRAFTQRFARYGLHPNAMSPVYGLAEATIAVTASRHDRPASSIEVERGALARGEVVVSEGGMELANVGRPLPDVQLQIRDPQGNALGEDRVGRLFVQSPAVMSGYVGLAEQPIEAGWLDTGDLGFLHAGELYITGRAKDLIICRGQNHVPQDLEQAADSVPGVRIGCRAAVSRIDTDGEQIIMFVESRAPRASMAEEVRVAVRSRTGVTPDRVVVLEPGSLPRTTSGKIRRAEALLRFEAGTLSQVPRAPNA